MLYRYIAFCKLGGNIGRSVGEGAEGEVKENRLVFKI